MTTVIPNCCWPRGSLGRTELSFIVAFVLHREDSHLVCERRTGPRWRKGEKLAHYSDLLYNPKLEGFAGVAEWVDAVDLKSKKGKFQK